MECCAKNKGFSLVELSVVMVIIALITSVVTLGTSIVKNSKLKVIIKELREHELSIESFKDKFKFAPGDFPDANKYWPAEAPGNGDGDQIVYPFECIGVIGTAGMKEEVKAWKHMELAGFTNGKSYTGDCVGNTYVAGANMPESTVIDQGTYFYHMGTATYYGRPPDNYIVFGHISPFTPWVGDAILNTVDAKAIDDKMDDGKADGGALFTANGDAFNKTSPNACVDGDFFDATSSYNISNTDVTCRLQYYINHN